MCSGLLLQDSLLVVGCGMGTAADSSFVVAGVKGRAVESAGLTERAQDWDGVGCRQERIGLPRCGGEW